MKKNGHRKHNKHDKFKDIHFDKEDFIKPEDLKKINSKKKLIKFLLHGEPKYKKIIDTVNYEKELLKLQIELVKMQRWVQEEKKRIAIIFEGRDAAGKGGTIRRFIEHMNPRAMRVVALPKPTEVEMGQWYFQRYINHLPNPEEIVFFDRSWYNRAVVEPVNGFCTEKQYRQYMRQVPEFENMLYEDGITVIKFWFSISKEEQLKRFEARKTNPLKQWKISPVDMKAQKLWDKYTFYKEEMFSRTHTTYSPWILIKANNKKVARLEAIRYVLATIPYKGKKKATVSLHSDPNVLTRFHRMADRID